MKFRRSTTNNINITPEVDDTEKEEDDISSKIDQTGTKANSTDSSEEQKEEYSYNRNHTELISEQAFQSNKSKDKRTYLNKILPNVGKRKGNMSIGNNLRVVLRSDRFDNEVFRKDKENKSV